MARMPARWSVSWGVIALAGLIVIFIVLSILLLLLGANEDNMIINAIVEVGNFFSTPFHGMFPQPTEDREILINWGIAALAYLAVGGLIARLARGSGS